MKPSQGIIPLHTYKMMCQFTLEKCVSCCFQIFECWILFSHWFQGIEVEKNLHTVSKNFKVERGFLDGEWLVWIMGKSSARGRQGWQLHCSCKWGGDQCLHRHEINIKKGWQQPCLQQQVEVVRCWRSSQPARLPQSVPAPAHFTLNLTISAMNSTGKLTEITNMHVALLLCAWCQQRAQGEMAATVPQLRTILISDCRELACMVAAIHSQLYTVYSHTTDKAHNMHVSEPVQTLSMWRNQYENQPWHHETTHSQAVYKTMCQFTLRLLCFSLFPNTWMLNTLFAVFPNHWSWLECSHCFQIP